MNPRSEPLAAQTLRAGDYQLQLSAAGGGLSEWRGLALNRWPGDALEDAHGNFIYLRDADSGALWSATRQPVPGAPEHYAVRAEAGRLCTEREEQGIASRLSVELAADGSHERRRLRLRNDSAQTRRIEVTSYIEIALAHRWADLGHPAFLKLFVQTELGEGGRLLLARRRPRGQGETWPTLFHALLGAPMQRWETDRCRFLGRGRDVAAPALELRGTVGNVLDPVFSLATTLELAAGESRELEFLFGVAGAPAQMAAIAAQVQLAPAWLPPPPEQAPLRSGLSADGSEYQIHLPWCGDGLQRPPMPWINVLANEQFGGLVSETGAGATWARNSQVNRLTPWSNDPVSDPHGEALYLRDETDGAYWSPLPGPVPAACDYVVAHGFGYSRYQSRFGELEQTVTAFVARQAPLKCLRLQLRNHGSAARELSLFGYQQLVLGTLPPAAGAIRSWPAGEWLCAAQTGSGAFAGAVVYAGLLAEGVTVQTRDSTCDRASFIGPLGSARRPRALGEPVLDGRHGEGLDACFGQRLRFRLDAGQSAEFCLLLGEAADAESFEALTAGYGTPAALRAAEEEVRAWWRQSLSGLAVRTPSPEIDHLVNGWLPYQALACRIWARTAYYQSSGAYGFRDQLQDAGNLSLLWPERTRSQILLHARQQFVEGDVLHWWHEPPLAAGLRTRFADDLLWLPQVTAAYLRATGDASVLDEPCRLLQAPPLKPGEDENYLTPSEAGAASLYEHCCRALDRSLAVGAHGLPLMGTGDWNDGMNRVGREGRGESVWMGFFLYAILGEFVPIAEARGDHTRAARYHAHRAALQAAVNTAGWDGAWYRRAYYDNGSVMGSHDAAECRIDGLAQAWAVLSGAAPAERAAQAMDAAEAQLIDEEAGLLRLLTPPFVDTPEDPGYIKGYVAGVRENGGQYTHAACWMVAALAKLGRRERAARLLTRLSPLWHSRDAAAQARYRVEPYVIAADIYGAAPHIGRGGWTWYTGSAGWAWRVAVESVLGLSIEQGQWLCFAPCVPDEWPGYTLDYRHPASGGEYRIEVENPERCAEAVVAAELDGEPLPLTAQGLRLRLAAGAHRLRLRLGRRAPSR